MIEKTEVSSLGKMLPEDPDSIMVIVSLFVITALFFKFISRLYQSNKTHVERATPVTVIYFEMFSCFLASSLLSSLGILKTKEATIDDISAISLFVLLVFLAWVLVGIFAYMNYRNNKPNLEHQKMRDELDDELYIIEEERRILGLKIPNNDELKNFHDMIDKYNVKVTMFNANGEQLK